MNKITKTSIALVFGLSSFFVAGAGTLGNSNENVNTAKAQEVNPYSFFEQHNVSASEVAKENGLYASVLLAQMAFESKYGDSSLSKKTNNYFGVKADFDKEGSNKKPHEISFKSYNTAKESMLDYASILNSERYKETHIHYAKTYKDATKALQGIYSTDPHYSDKLNRIIEKYKLTQYDSDKSNAANSKKKSDLKKKAGSKKKANSKKKKTYSGVKYIVKKGDTLYSLAKKYDTTVKSIKESNGLSSNLIRTGDLIFIKAGELRK